MILLFVTILHAKFCTSCSLLIFLAEVFDQAEEQYRSLFITNADTKRNIVSLSKHLLTRLICDNLDMQEETNSVIWQSYDMLVSLINPKS